MVASVTKSTVAARSGSSSRHSVFVAAARSGQPVGSKRHMDHGLNENAIDIAEQTVAIILTIAKAPWMHMLVANVPGQTPPGY